MSAWRAGTWRATNEASAKPDSQSWWTSQSGAGQDDVTEQAWPVPATASGLVSPPLARLENHRLGQGVVWHTCGGLASARVVVLSPQPRELSA